MAPATIGAAAVQVNVLRQQQLRLVPRQRPGVVAERRLPLHAAADRPLRRGASAPSRCRSSRATRARGDATALARDASRQALELVGAALPARRRPGWRWFGVPVIGLIYEHGRFTAADTAAAAQALAGYAVGLAGYAGIKVLAPAFYALDDARTPMRVSLLSIAVELRAQLDASSACSASATSGSRSSTSAVALGNFALLYVAAAPAHRAARRRARRRARAHRASPPCSWRGRRAGAWTRARSRRSRRRGRRARHALRVAVGRPGRGGGVLGGVPRARGRRAALRRRRARGAEAGRAPQRRSSRGRERRARRPAAGRRARAGRGARASSLSTGMPDGRAQPAHEVPAPLADADLEPRLGRQRSSDADARRRRPARPRGGRRAAGGRASRPSGVPCTFTW